MKNSLSHDVANLKLAPEGKKKIEWAGQNSPVLNLITEEFSRTKPLKGLTIAACLHVTSETANLMLAYVAGGAKVVLCASNPLSTQDMVAASLVVDYGIPVFAIHGEDKKTYYQHLNKALDFHPNLTTDDGADLVSLLHTERTKQLVELIGSAEETTTGVIRLKAMAHDKALKIPVLAINESDTKHLFDNRYGTGQSTVDGIIRTTNILLAGKRVVVCGYGWCSRGIASRMRGMGAIVTVTEVDPVKALEAVMDGFTVDQIGRAVRYGDVFVSATGDKQVITLAHMKRMKDGAILANSGHFNVEFDYDGLVKLAKSRRILRNNLEELVLPTGKRLYALGEGRLINLAGAEGHPAEVMDMSFANQALGAAWFVKRKGTLQPKVYVLPKDVDQRVARLKLRAMGMRFDRLTQIQRKYLHSWTEGT
ncbi:MAG: adenosylhomocysteinase [Candidatus Gottesmanbacteria bacterium]|nr:adenosylhomocysteinase [Candidatus Gottesmanbacteria bacterium]